MKTSPVVQTVTTVTGTTIDLTAAEARLLRNLLGGLKQKTRRGAVRKNGGTKEQAQAANLLASDLWKALQADGFAKFGEEVSTPDNDSSVEEDYGDDPYLDDDTDDVDF